MSDNKYRLKAHELACGPLYNTLALLEDGIHGALVESAREAMERAADIASSNQFVPSKVPDIGIWIAEAIRKETL